MIMLNPNPNKAEHSETNRSHVRSDPYMAEYELMWHRERVKGEMSSGDQPLLKHPVSNQLP